MKNLKVVMLAALVASGLAGCSKECTTHTDKNHDGTCEVCGKTGLAVTHVDESPKDHKCDVCGTTMSQHADANNDHNCDYCGAKLSEHVDANPKDHVCDSCGAKLSDCVDGNHDGTCDYCGKTGLPVTHVDQNHDGVCDVAACAKEGLEVHHVDADADAKCDVCGKAIICEFAELDLTDVKVDFTKGDEFTSEGLKVIGTFTDETTKELEIVSISEPDLNTVGTKEVTVTYIANGTTETLYYDVEVSFWDEDAKEIMEAASLYSYCGYYPYMKGMYAEYDVDPITKELLDWNLTLDNATEDDLAAYWELMKYFDVTGESGRGEEIYYQPFEMDAEGAGLGEKFGLVEESVRVFELIPYSIGDYGAERNFVYDEYTVFGLTEDGKMKVFNKLVKSYFDGVFGADNLYYSFWSSKAYTSQLFGYIGLVSGFYFSEIAEDYIPGPVCNNGYAMLTSLNTAYPFADALDGIDMGIDAEAVGGTATDEAKFRTALGKAGYEQDAENANMYVLEDKYVGKMTVIIRPYDDNYFTNLPAIGQPLTFTDYDTKESVTIDAGYGVRYLYEAPENFVTAVDPEIDNLLEAFAEVGETEFIPAYYEYGLNYGDVYVAGTEETPADPITVVDALVAKMPTTYKLIGYDYDSDYECYVLNFTNYVYDVEIDVFEADKDFGVEATVSVEAYYSDAEYVLAATQYYMFGDEEAFDVYENVPLHQYYYQATLNVADQQALGTSVNKIFSQLFDVVGTYYDSTTSTYQAAYEFDNVTILVLIMPGSTTGTSKMTVIANQEIDPVMALYQASLCVLGEPCTVQTVSEGVYGFSAMMFPAGKYPAGYEAALLKTIMNGIGSIYTGVSDINSQTGVASVTCLTYDGATELTILVYTDGDAAYYFQVVAKAHVEKNPIEIGTKLATMFMQSLANFADGSVGFASSMISSLSKIATTLITYRPEFSTWDGKLYTVSDGIYCLVFTSENKTIETYVYLTFQGYTKTATITEANFAAALKMYGKLYKLVGTDYVEVTEFEADTQYYSEQYGIQYVVTYVDNAYMTPEYIVNFVNAVALGGDEVVIDDDGNGSVTVEYASATATDELTYLNSVTGNIDSLTFLTQVSEPTPMEGGGYVAVYEQEDSGVIVTVTSKYVEGKGVVVTITTTYADAE